MKALLILVIAFSSIWIISWLFLLQKPIQWGHHFTFHNELGIFIDSIQISIGGEERIITVREDHTLEGNCQVNEIYAPQEVRITIFTEDQIIEIPADSFNCYNCDGYHNYDLQPQRAVYWFQP
ncbi:MAG: hypothetical protein AAGF87_11120 [Bacteroidota bacterium]